MWNIHNQQKHNDMAKFIARKDFRNNCGLDIKDPIHPDHVHKGAIFTLGADNRGNDLPLEKAKEMVAAQSELIVALDAAECIYSAEDAAKLKLVQDEVAADKRREAREAEVAKSVATANLANARVAAAKA